MSLILGTLAACSQAPPQVDPPEPESPAVDLTRVEEVLQAAFDLAPSADAYVLRDTYHFTMGQSDNCPGEFGGFWYDDCETSSGVHFGGYVFELEEAFEDSSYWTLYGVATVTWPDASAFVLAGYAGLGEGIQDDLTYVYSYLYGTFHDPGAPGWMGQGYDADITVQAFTHLTGPRGLSVVGSMGGVLGDPAVAVDFDAISVVEAGWPEQTCSGQPMGAVSVRLAEGIWVDVDFGSTCDGCGDASTVDEWLGEVCVDASSWLDWEVSPW